MEFILSLGPTGVILLVLILIVLAINGKVRQMEVRVDKMVLAVLSFAIIQVELGRWSMKDILTSGLLTQLEEAESSGVLQKLLEDLV